MSQKKVDEYKKYKQNRRENIKKEKRKEQLSIAAVWGVIVLFIVCVGASMGVTIYNNYQAKLAALPTYAATSFVLLDLAGIQSVETEEEPAGEAETEKTEETSEEASEEETSTQTENEETESESAEN